MTDRRTFPATVETASVMPRRSFLALSAGAMGLAWAAPAIRAGEKAGISGRYAGLESDRFLGKTKIETTLDNPKVFTEGPAADGDGNLFFTNVPAEQILKWDPQSQKLSVFRTNSNKANGLYFEPDGNLLGCEGGAGRVTRTLMSTGRIVVLADSYNGFPFAAPNDICRDSRGHIYFTSRPGTTDPEKGNVNAVYCLTEKQTAFGATQVDVKQILAWPDIHMPNGIVTSPDEKTLYLIEAHPDEGKHRDIRAYDLQPDGSVKNERVVIDFSPGRSGDGMCIDAEGNLYVAAGLHKTRKTSETLDTRPGIHVISPEGKLLAFRETPIDTVTNCTFGGKDLRTLYVTCGKHLVSIPTQIPGKPTYRPKSTSAS